MDASAVAVARMGEGEAAAAVWRFLEDKVAAPATPGDEDEDQDHRLCVVCYLPRERTFVLQKCRHAKQV